MRFSIIIPVYNSAEYLRACLDSILRQTFTDFECFCVDDGSTDGSGEILDDYSRRDSRIKVLHKQNEGVSVARNVALEKVTGEIVCFVDSDDEVDLDWLQVYDKAFKEPDVDVVRLKSDAGWISTGYPWAYAIRRNIAVKTTFPEGVVMGEDGLYIAKLQPFVKRVTILPVITYHHVIRSGSAMQRRLSSVERLRYLLEVLSIVQQQPDFDRDVLSGKTSAGIIYWACRPLDKVMSAEIRKAWLQLRSLGCSNVGACDRLFLVPYWVYGVSGWIWPIQFWSFALRVLVSLKRTVAKS